MMYLNRLWQCLCTLGVSVLTLTLCLWLARVLFVGQVFSSEQLQTHTQGLLEALWMGLRFDAKAAVIALAPWWFMAFVGAASSAALAVYQRGARWYVALAIGLCALASIANYFYFATYGNHFDAFAFNFFDGETQAVATNLWQDYPVLRSVAVSVLLAALALLGVRRLQRAVAGRSVAGLRVVAAAALSLLLMAGLARGTLTTFPLGKEHANISSMTLLNQVTPNAVMALYWAVKDYRASGVLAPVTTAELTEQLQRVIGRDTPVYQVPHNSYLAQHKPNVVVALMESLGTNVLHSDHPQRNDLLGALRPELARGFNFKRFASGTDGTWESIMMLLTLGDRPTLSRSTYSHRKLPSIATTPYQRAGYEVSFIYAGDGTWQNSKAYLLGQGFDHYYDKHDIAQRFPESLTSAAAWGLADEYAFAFARELLAGAKRPQMLFIMSISNHPPYQLPSTYQAGPVAVTPYLQQSITNTPAEARKALETYQYSNDVLGRFINGLSRSEVGDNTVVAVAGDHHVRNMKLSNPGEMALAVAVPFYLRVPEPILQRVPHRYKPQRIGSHRDIFPTLYHFSLSDAEYTSLGGQNLLGPEVDNIGYNQDRVFTRAGVYAQAQPQALYPWREGSVLTETTPIPNPQPQWVEQYQLLQDMYIRWAVHKGAE
jgi:phosphoglycerol transferase MdoB-like AlkP superfamily enzyme